MPRTLVAYIRMDWHIVSRRAYDMYPSIGDIAHKTQCGLNRSIPRRAELRAGNFPPNILLAPKQIGDHQIDVTHSMDSQKYNRTGNTGKMRSLTMCRGQSLVLLNDAQLIFAGVQSCALFNSIYALCVCSHIKRWNSPSTFVVSLSCVGRE